MIIIRKRRETDITYLLHRCPICYWFQFRNWYDISRDRWLHFLLNDLRRELRRINPHNENIYVRFRNTISSNSLRNLEQKKRISKAHLRRTEIHDSRYASDSNYTKSPNAPSSSSTHSANQQWSPDEWPSPKATCSWSTATHSNYRKRVTRIGYPMGGWNIKINGRTRRASMKAKLTASRSFSP